ncbi:MAG: nucleotidyl transferase AbiEii/AbiGii toxin family protein [Sulfuricurvum sp.]
MSIQSYISGWEALNIPTSDGSVADWHPKHYFGDDKKLVLYHHNSILGDRGIQKRFIPMLNAQGYVASYARAIADLVYNDDTIGLKNCVYDYLDDDEACELFDYLLVMRKHKDVEDFMRHELTKLYFKDKSHLGDYPLKIEVSNRNRPLLQAGLLSYDKIDGVNVYSIDELIKMKTVAFSGRDKIRDFYDLGFLLEKYPSEFSKESLFAVHEKILYAGVDELNLLLKDEAQKHKLVSKQSIDITDNYAQKILYKVEDLMKQRPVVKSKDRESSIDWF